MSGSYFIVENRDLVRKNGFFFTCCQTGNSRMDFEREFFFLKHGSFEKGWNSVKVCKSRDFLQKCEKTVIFSQIVKKP